MTTGFRESGIWEKRWIFSIRCGVISWFLALGIATGQVADYTDPPAWPTIWPPELETRAYTRLGQPQHDGTGNPDKSRGASLSGAADFSSGGGSAPSFFYFGDGRTIYFRLRVDGPPVNLNPSSAAPFTNGTWNLLFDVDGDGWKDFVLQVYGGDGNTSNPVDDMLVLWDEQLSQTFTIGFSNVWKQDSVRHPSNRSMDGVNGEPGSVEQWDSDPDDFVWDYGRTRIVQIDRSMQAGHNNSEYYIDIQIPLSVLDATELGGIFLTSKTPFSLSATTSNSNTDPTQKDLLYSGEFTLGNVPIPGGDITNPEGSIFQYPVIRSITATNCPSVVLDVNVMDTLDVVGGVAVDTLNTVYLEYYYDLNNDGLANDGFSWTTIGAASRTSRLGRWNRGWETDGLPQGSYLVRATATDNQGNVTVSTDQPLTFPDGVQATVDNTCGLPLLMLSGRVFEDVNYGGGAGRSLAASSGIGRSGARVELFLPNGNFAQAVETDENGQYLFPALPPATTYTVRVVNDTVSSSRPGYVDGLLPVQTYRKDATGGAVVDILDRVGGENPAIVDAPESTPGMTLAELSSATYTPQSIATVALGTESLSGVDFGYNFTTIVNTRDSGQGSLRQFILNANALGDESSLAQTGNLAGRETSIFMIPSGVSVPGIRGDVAGQLTDGVAVIQVESSLPTLISPFTSIDGKSQTFNVGDTNAIVLGTGGIVGSASIPLTQVAGPEIQIQGADGITVGLDVSALHFWIRGLAVTGFGSSPDIPGHANIQVSSSGDFARIEETVVGASARTFSLPTASFLSDGDNIRIDGASHGTIQNSLVGFGGGNGLVLAGGAGNWSILGNEFRENGATSPGFAGLRVHSGADTVITGNLFAGNFGAGVDVDSGAGSVAMVNNTVVGNGSGEGVTAGVRLGSSGATVDRNRIQGNRGAGIMVLPGSGGNWITKNSIFGNGTSGSVPTGQIGIDLLSAGEDSQQGSSPFVTLNDSGDTDLGGNGLLNYPILASAVLDDGNLIVTGFAGAGGVVEFFEADADPRGFGEGRTYLFSRTEGASDDEDSSVGSYSGPINGRDQGADSANRFSFSIPVPSGVTAGTILTATLTKGGETSEFSGVVAVQKSVSISGNVYDDLNGNGIRDAGEEGTGLTLFIKLLRQSEADGPALYVVAVDPVVGFFEFPKVFPGEYLLVLDDNDNVSDATPTIPLGRRGTDFPSLMHAVVVGHENLDNVDFGLATIVALQGRVFLDTGVGGGIANDGIRNGAETGLGGVSVKLTNEAGSVVHATAVSDGAGYFAIPIPEGVAEGTLLKIVKINPAGKISTAASPGIASAIYDRASDSVRFEYNGDLEGSSVEFGVVPENQFLTNGAQTGLPGTALFYSHTFIAGSAGTVSFASVDLPSPQISGWNSVVYWDVNNSGTIEPEEPMLLSPLEGVEAGQTVSIIVKNYIPVTASYNAQDQITVRADFEYSNAVPALSSSQTRTNLTTVGPGAAGLTLVKSVDKPTALPGDVIVFTIQYTNNGADALQALSITDRIPAFTSLVAISASELPSGLSGVNMTTDSPEIGYLKWMFDGRLHSGQGGSVTFSVKINE